MTSDSFTPLRIAIAGSRTVPGVRQLLANPNRGRLFELACVIATDERLEEEEDLALFRVPVLRWPERVESDYVFVTADRTVLSSTLIDAFPHRIFTLDTGDVLGQLFAGETETRSSMSLADGAVFLMSSPFPVPPLIADARERGDAEMIEAYAALHRRWMIEASWGVMLQKAIEFLAAGSVQIVHGVVWVDGVPGPCRLGDAPAVCREHDSRVPHSCPFIAGE